MNTLFQQAIGSIIRWLLAIAAGYLVNHGIWSKGDADSYVTAAALAIAALLWSLIQKYKSRVHFLTALEMPAGTSEAKVADRIKIGGGVAPMILLALVLGGAAASFTACAPKSAPVLSPAQQAAAILQRVDELQNAVISANQLTPGAIPDRVAVPLVKFCVEAAKVLKDAPNGVLPAIAAEWRSLKAQVPPEYRRLPAIAGAYLAVDLALAEFGQ